MPMECLKKARSTSGSLPGLGQEGIYWSQEPGGARRRSQEAEPNIQKKEHRENSQKGRRAKRQKKDQGVRGNNYYEGDKGSS